MRRYQVLIIFVVKEGVSVLRTRFGFTRTTGTSNRAVAGNYYTLPHLSCGEERAEQQSQTSFFLSGPVSQASPKTERRQRLFLRKLEYFNSSGAPETNIKQNCNANTRLGNNSRVAVNNSINRAKQSHYNAKEEEPNRNRSVKSFSKCSPGLSSSPRKTVDQHRGGSELKKPFFVTKYSPYRGDSAKQSVPLIMTTGRQQISPPIILCHLTL